MFFCSRVCVVFFCCWSARVCLGVLNFFLTYSRVCCIFFLSRECVCMLYFFSVFVSVWVLYFLLERACVFVGFLFGLTGFGGGGFILNSLFGGCVYRRSFSMSGSVASHICHIHLVFPRCHHCYPLYYVCCLITIRLKYRSQVLKNPALVDDLFPPLDILSFVL